MPNHITTSVEIKGPKEKLAKLIKDTKLQLDVDVEDNVFDFNGIVRMPKELSITSGSMTDLGMMAHSQEQYEKDTIKGMPWWSERYPGVTDAASLKEFLEKSDEESHKIALKEGKQALDNIEKYGVKDWYDWSVANWGTKWNAYDVKYTAHDDNHLVLDITTAWDTPHGIWNKLREKGFEVNGIYYGEMEGTGTIGDGGPFWADVSVQFSDDFSGYEEA